MELIRGRQNLREQHHGCVVTIGNFDGVHLGHQAVLSQLVDKARQLGVPGVIIMFEPHPQEYFANRVGDPVQRINPPARLTRFREKLQSLQHYAVDRVLCIRFNEAFAHLSAEDFIEQLLVGQLGVRCLIIGDDFHFGHRRQGDLAMLRRAGERHDFQVVNMHTFNIDGDRVSSTRIREALWSGDLNAAGILLGRAYHMAGRIVHGDKRGRRLGFPTANIYLHRQVSPLRGVFAVSVFGLDHEPIDGVANIGVRPSVDGQQCLLEVHLIDFIGDIYGRHVRVMFIERLRDECRFETLEALKQQITLDVKQARTLFENNGEQIRRMRIET